MTKPRRIIDEIGSKEKAESPLLDTVKALIKAGHIAQFEAKDEDGAPLPSSEHIWVGDKEWPVYLGFPFKVLDGEDLVPLNVGGIDLKPVFYSSDHHCVVYVREDAYPE